MGVTSPLRADAVVSEGLTNHIFFGVFGMMVMFKSYVNVKVLSSISVTFCAVLFQLNEFISTVLLWLGSQYPSNISINSSSILCVISGNSVPLFFILSSQGVSKNNPLIFLSLVLQ